MRIRPCIDIHNGKVKQIVGGTLRETGARENYVAVQNADYFAGIYREKNLPGGHIILLNARAADPEMYEADRRQALGALKAYPGGMQIGGGITPENAEAFLDAGASHVIVTSYVFRNGQLDWERLREIESAVGKERLVLDLSCRRRGDSYYVVTDRWQKWTNLEVSAETLDELSGYCDEFLIHAADVEGQQRGIERKLVHILGGWLEKNCVAHAAAADRGGDGGDGTGRQFPVTYAGGVHSLEDLEVMKRESNGLLDVTVGSALDLFGGALCLDELVQAVE